MSAPKCSACGKRKATHCDALVDVTPERVMEGYRTGEGPSLTCDAPVCGSCRVPVAARFFCGGKWAAGVDSHDLCPKHGRLEGIA